MDPERIRHRYRHQYTGIELIVTFERELHAVESTAGTHTTRGQWHLSVESGQRVTVHDLSKDFPPHVVVLHPAPGMQPQEFYRMPDGYPVSRNVTP